MRKLLLNATVLIFLTIGAYGQEKMENLKIIWPEKYEWKIGLDLDHGSVHMLELIPGNEDADKWTIKVTTMSVKGAKNVFTMDQMMTTVFDQAKQNAPKATMILIEKNESAKNPWIIFKIETSGFNSEINPRSELYYLIQGESSLYSNFVSIKENALSEEFVDRWKLIFKASELVYK